jgi:hypothetical protein
MQDSFRKPMADPNAPVRVSLLLFLILLLLSFRSSLPTCCLRASPKFGPQFAMTLLIGIFLDRLVTHSCQIRRSRVRRRRSPLAICGLADGVWFFLTQN